MTNEKQIRWLVLLVLLENQRSKHREAGGWMRLAMLQKLLSQQGYDLTQEELKTVCVYLADPEIHCLEIHRENDMAPHVYKYRITARGVRVAGQEERAPGVGIYS